MMKKSTYQKGQSTVYIIIFIVLVLFAVSLSGGGSSLFTGNEPSSVTDTPTPTGTSSTTTTPTTTASGTWNITVTLDPGCKTGKSDYVTGNVKVNGPSNGTVELTVGTNTVGTQPFTTPEGNFPLNLSNDDGFNTTDWKITVTSGGTLQKTYNGTKTGC